MVFENYFYHLNHVHLNYVGVRIQILDHKFQNKFLAVLWSEGDEPHQQFLGLLNQISIIILKKIKNFGNNLVEQRLY